MTAPQAQEVEALLHGLQAALQVQERLAALIEARTTALRHADAQAMADAAREEDAALREGVALERERRARTASLGKALGLPTTPASPPSPRSCRRRSGERVLAERDALRAAAAANRSRAAAAARAAATTAAHVEGLLRRVTERSTGGARYAATGRHAPARRSLPRVSLTA